MANNRRRVIVLGDTRKENVSAALDRAVPILEDTVEVVAADLNDSTDLESLTADLAFVFGGDGAILKAVRRLGANCVPVCGVNLGKLGFLATLTCDDLRAGLCPVLEGNYTVLSAMTLDCTVSRNGLDFHQARAVNDVVVSRGALSRIVPVDLLIDRQKVTTYNGDGLIVSTPLGSTAHSLSAGGPIIEPCVEAMILTPICPHTLSNRPLVISADKLVQLRIGAGPEGSALTVDGQVYQPLQKGDEVTIRRSEKPFRLIRVSGHDYFRTLRDKLGWSGHLGT